MLPRALNDPRHRPLQALRFFLNFLEHCLRKVEALFALVALRDLRTASTLVVSHGFWRTVSHIVTASVERNAGSSYAAVAGAGASASGGARAGAGAGPGADADADAGADTDAGAVADSVAGAGSGAGTGGRCRTTLTAPCVESARSPGSPAMAGANLESPAMAGANLESP